MLADELMRDIPAPFTATAADVRAAMDPTSLVIVLDDDPTGTQSVAGLPVLTRWEREDLRGAIATGAPAIYVLTNTRSLDEATTESRVREVVDVASAEAASAGRSVTFVSRSDSTLRGHFPLETDVIGAELETRAGSTPDLTILIPAFPDAGRVTVRGGHYWLHDGTATPVGETPFAADPTFGFTSSDLRDWVEEKTEGHTRREDVVLVDIDSIRSGPEAVSTILSAAPSGSTVVVDVVDESDMRVVAIAVHRLESRTVLLRVGPPYVRAHIGQEIPQTVSAEEIDFASVGGGLIIVGSHVPLTTEQLDHLKQHRPDTPSIEVDVHQLLKSGSDEYIAERAAAAVEALRSNNVVIHTSRSLVTGGSGDESLAIARTVSAALVSLVRRVLDTSPPRFVIAKGGITSSDIASEALEIRRATVLGPMLPGIVSLWQPEVGRAVGVPYVVFAGNVGDASSLSEVVTTLTSPEIEQTRKDAQ